MKRYTRVCAKAATAQMDRNRRRLFKTKFALLFITLLSAMNVDSQHKMRV
jgi:hypothetical protein